MRRFRNLIRSDPNPKSSRQSFFLKNFRAYLFEIIEVTSETEVQIAIEEMREPIGLVQQRLQTNEVLRNARSRNDDNCNFRLEDMTGDCMTDVSTV